MLSHKDLLLLFEGKSPERRQEMRDAMGGCPFDVNQCPDDYCEEHWCDGDEDEEVGTDLDLVPVRRATSGKKGTRARSRANTHTYEQDRTTIADVLHVWAMVGRTVLAGTFALVVLMVLIRS